MTTLSADKVALRHGISILIVSRAEGNPDQQLARTIDSLAAQVVGSEDEVEVLVKFDSDDTRRPILRQYPFPVKEFVYSRGEGRQYNHHHLEYLFSQRNTSFHWVMNVADDFVFTRPFLADLEAIVDPFAVVGYTNPDFASNLGVYEFHHPVNFGGNTGIGAYCPLVTARLIEVCQNWGWQPNPDGWLVLLNCCLLRLYGYTLWHTIPESYVRTGGYGLGDTGHMYNNMTITGRRLPENKYYIRLVEQQAHTIHLHRVHAT